MNEEYRGLNLPQLLDLMHALVEPEPVSWMPQTVGWWVLAAWVVVGAGLLAWHAYGVWRRNRYRQEALAALDAIEARARAGESSAEPVAVLLKRTALAAYPREEVARLYGADWARFLGESSGNDPVVASSAEHLANAAYRADVDATALIEPARRWIEVHRA